MKFCSRISSKLIASINKIYYFYESLHVQYTAEKTYSKRINSSGSNEIQSVEFTCQRKERCYFIHKHVA